VYEVARILLGPTILDTSSQIHRPGQPNTVASYFMILHRLSVAIKLASCFYLYVS
jgi:hypothetical protein